MEPALILFAHGARDEQWAAPFARVLARVRAQAPRRDAVLAFLEFMKPDMDEAVATLVARGHRAIRVVPLVLGPGGHLRQQLPELAAAAERRHPGVSIDIAAPAGEDSGVVAALASYAVR